MSKSKKLSKSVKRSLKIPVVLGVVAAFAGQALLIFIRKLEAKHPQFSHFMEDRLIDVEEALGVKSFKRREYDEAARSG